MDGNSEAKQGEENIEGGHSYVNSFYFSQRFLLENLTDIPYLLITLRRDKVSKLSRNNLSDQLNNIHPKFLCDNEGDDKTPIQQNRRLLLVSRVAYRLNQRRLIPGHWTSMPQKSPVLPYHNFQAGNYNRLPDDISELLPYSENLVI